MMAAVDALVVSIIRLQTTLLNTQKGYHNPEDVYPYIGKEGDCKFDSNKGINQIQSYVHGIEEDEEYLKKLVA